MPAHRARTLLFLIESRTAHLVARSRRAMERFSSERAGEERDLDFLEAFHRRQRPTPSPHHPGSRTFRPGVGISGAR